MAEPTCTTGYTLVPFSKPDEPKLKVTHSRVDWLEYPTSVTLYLPDKEPQILNVTDYITYEGREGPGVMIVQFCGSKEDTGPIGFRYLPWREEGRWASLQFSLRGDSRFIICHPVGAPHCGQHITWNTLKNINHLAPIDHPVYQTKLRSVKETVSE